MITYETIMRFFNLQSIAIGILQMISIKFPVHVIANSKVWLRTVSILKPSEFLAKAAMKNIIFSAIIKINQNPIIKIIREKQNKPDFDENFSKAA